MADDADRAQQDAEVYDSILSRHYDLPHGEPGDCRNCLEHSPRLVKGLCAICRDEEERVNKRLGK